MFDQAIIKAAQEHALRDYPRESVGLVSEGRYIPVENIDPDPTKGFAFPDDLQLQYRIDAVIHSHPDGWEVPSAADMQQQQAMDIPWGIVAVRKDKAGLLYYTPATWFGPGVPKGPLIGRGFIHGVQDCLSLILDWHAERGIFNPEHPRDWEWWNGEDDFYTDLFEPYGFQRVDGPSEGAVFLVAIGTDANKKPITKYNHGGIYVGNGMVLHHLNRHQRGAPIDRASLSARHPIVRFGNSFNIPPVWIKHRDLK